jgi:glycosyltransferase involved in cell wall biosynthesis
MPSSLDDPISSRDVGHLIPSTTKVGVVAIGRNEGIRLKKCLESIDGMAQAIVYVDSGSTDDSVELANSRASVVVEFDLSTPFTAARARNQGFHKLREIQPDIEFVFFVDGDCEVVPGWLNKAVSFLAEHRDMAVVWAYAGKDIPRSPSITCYATSNGETMPSARHRSAAAMR